MRSVWADIEPLLRDAQRPSRYLNHEFGSTVKEDASFHFCMVYPDTYELGQANQALRILANAVNRVDGMEAQRAFLPAPDFCDCLRKKEIPLFSLETCSPLLDFDAIGITLPHELAASNILEILDLSHIPLHADERTESHPFVLGGGPCALNPEPFAPFFDCFSIGEGEEAVPELLEIIRAMKNEGASRKDILMRLAQEPGCYVPGLYERRREDDAQKNGSWLSPRADKIPRTIRKRVFKTFAQSPAGEPCIVPFAEVVHDRLNIEVLRGCARGCRFCQAGMMYRPVRERDADAIVKAAVDGLNQTGYDEVSLTSLSTTDHSQIESILMRLNRHFEGKGMRVSIPSQRLDSFGISMASLVAGQKKGGLTFAPEAGTQRLRDAINKNVTEEHLFNAVDAAFAEGWRRCKLYFMIGLPTETDEDIKGIASLVQRVFDHARKAVPPEQRGAVQIGVSCALFVPKAQTPFQWFGQIPPEEAQRRIDLLRHSIKYRAIRVSWHDPATSYLEAALSRGGRDLAAVVEEAWRNGARFDAWSECFDPKLWEDAASSVGVDLHQVAQADYDSSYIMPFEHIDMGISRAFLVREYRKTLQAETTPDCTFGPCSACGVCSVLSVANETVLDRNQGKEAGPPEAVLPDFGLSKTASQLGASHMTGAQSERGE